MWKKEDAEKRAGVPSEPRPEPREKEQRTPSADRGERATIGRSITLRGEVTGDEDLLIQGRVEGTVDLKQHAVTVGPDGEVKADISGRVVTVEGSVEGNLRADEQVVLRSTARLQGDISAPRVTLEDGAYFRGGVDMIEPGADRSSRPEASGLGRTERSAAGPTPPSVGGASPTEKGADATGSAG
jgi:cytoskeletal protein CcmA (bactofilin family)